MIPILPRRIAHNETGCIMLQYRSWIRYVSTARRGRGRRQPTYRPLLEALECRLAPATLTWTEAGGFRLWSSGFGPTGQAPQSGDSLVFPNNPNVMGNSENDVSGL